MKLLSSVTLTRAFRRAVGNPMLKTSLVGVHGSELMRG